jgi:hypothetical protein
MRGAGCIKEPPSAVAAVAHGKRWAFALRKFARVGGIDGLLLLEA